VRAATVLIVCVGCGRIGFGVRAEVDARTDGAPLGAWSAPTQLLADSGPLDDPSATGDGLEMYVNGSPGEVFVTRRSTTSEPWGALVLEPTLSINVVSQPAITSDGLALALIRCVVLWALVRAHLQGGHGVQREHRPASRQPSAALPSTDGRSAGVP
jgi:hypothetical protein